MLALHGEGSEEFLIQFLKFMQNRVDIKNQVDSENNNILHIATKSGKFELIKVLIEELGFNVNDSNFDVI